MPNPDLTTLQAQVAALEALTARLTQRIQWLMDELQSHRGGYAPLPPPPADW